MPINELYHNWMQQIYELRPNQKPYSHTTQQPYSSYNPQLS